MSVYDFSKATRGEVYYFEPKVVRIRKSHTCNICLQQFDKGSEMTKFISKRRGKFFIEYCCNNCIESM